MSLIIPLPVNKYSLTIAEAAACLGLSSAKVYKLVRDKIIPAQKEGRIWQVPVDAISVYVHRA